jgi:hypothetical protein
MFVFNLIITLILILILGYLTGKMNSRLSLDIKTEEILLSWFIALVLVIIIRCMANAGLHYEISNQKGRDGLPGNLGNRGIKGNDAVCN